MDSLTGAASETPKEITPLLRTFKRTETVEETEGSGPKVREKKEPVKRKAMSALETAVREYLERYPDAILLTQVGSFFEVSELYFLV